MFSSRANKQPNMKPTAIILSLILALFAACSDGSRQSSADTDEGESVDYKALDKDVEEEINAPNAAEARVWLAVPNNAIFEGSKAEVIALTESFYQAGCPKVYITGIEEFGGTKVSASLVAVLPSDPAQRAKAFKVENEFAKKMGEDGCPDKGQKYLWLGFD